MTLAPEAEAELDEIWAPHRARERKHRHRTRQVEKIAEHFWLLARYPYLGRAREQDLAAGLRSLAVDDYLIIHRIADDDVVLILHVVHGRRELARLLAQ